MAWFNELVNERHRQTLWTWGRRVIWILLMLWAVDKAAPSFLSSLRPPDWPGDLFQEWASARNFFQGMPVYTDHAETCERYLGVKHDDKDVEHRWRMAMHTHPPSAVLLAMPFSLFDYPVGHVLWNVLSLAAVGLSIALIVRELKIPCSIWMALPVIAFLMAFPIHVQLYLANWNCFFLLLCTGMWLADRWDRPAWAGLCISLMVAVKLFPAILFLYFLVRRDWRTIVWGVAWLGMLQGISLAVFGLDQHIAYFTEALPHGHEWKAIWCNFSISGFWYKLFTCSPKDHVNIPLTDAPLIAQTGVAITSAALLLVLGYFSRRAESRTQRDHALGLSVTAMILLAPIGWDHYFVMLTLPCLLLWQTLPAWGATRGVFWACLFLLWKPAFTYFKIMAVPILKPETVLVPADMVMLASIPFYALLGIWFLSAWAARPLDSRTGAAEPIRTTSFSESARTLDLAA